MDSIPKDDMKNLDSATKASNNKPRRFLKTTRDLIEVDDYAPTEELLGLEPVGTYIRLKRNQFEFIQNDYDEYYQEAILELNSSPMIGFDTEFFMHDQATICLIQIA